MALLTLLHVSDLHFGSLARGSGSLDAAALGFWRMNRHFDGFLGHAHGALLHLKARARQLHRADPDLRAPTLIVTGDLSAVGDARELEDARAFLTAGLGRAPHVGLFTPDAMRRTIPGNHDHWPGHRGILGAPTSALHHTFPTPLVEELVDVPGTSARVRLIGINSDADVWPWGPARFFARGRCLSAIADAARAFGPPHPDEIRVLLAHHTLLQRDYVTGLTAATRRAFERLIADHDIAVVLGGHVHEVRCDTYSSPSATRQCLLVCAGTTTQLDQPPASWRLADKDVARFRDNTLFVHRIIADDRRLFWEATEERRCPTGFAPEGVPVAPIQVWPRV